VRFYYFYEILLYQGERSGIFNPIHECNDPTAVVNILAKLRESFALGLKTSAKLFEFDRKRFSRITIKGVEF
jgi:hypothetical protein